MMYNLKKNNMHFFASNYLFASEWIILGINNVCNIYCKMCEVRIQTLEANFAQNFISSNPINMPLDHIKRNIDLMAYYYPKSKLRYAFTELLVYPYLEAFLSYAKQKKRNELKTNVKLFTFNSSFCFAF